MAAVKWGTKKCQGHCKRAKDRRALKRAEEKKTRGRAARTLRADGWA